eukprot:1765292-Rhodomonas_salina.1
MEPQYLKQKSAAEQVGLRTVRYCSSFSTWRLCIVMSPLAAERRAVLQQASDDLFGANAVALPSMPPATELFWCGNGS